MRQEYHERLSCRPKPCGCAPVPCKTQSSEGNPCIPQPACPPRECSCHCPPRNCSAGYLLPRILASGRQWLRRSCTTLCIEGMDRCMEGPFSLVSVSAAAEQASWEIVPQPSPQRMVLHVRIPLHCQIRDVHGCLHCGNTAIQTDVCLSMSHCAHDGWRNTLMILPCVRLACLPCPSADLCFEAQLEILLEAYMVRWEPCQQNSSPGQDCACAMRDVPLYPELRMS